jgi:dihydrofolate reductase/thymidylate synthase
MKFKAIVSFCKGFGIGKDGSIPWNVPEDLARFQKLTRNSIVLMGKSTFLSIPENRRPLKDRLNIVITKNPEEFESYDDLIFSKIDQVDKILELNAQIYDQCFIIGGSRIYEEYLHLCENIYVTYVDKKYECDVFFPIHLMGKSHFLSKVEPSDIKDVMYLTYDRTHKENADVTYINLLSDILQNGDQRVDRTGTGTISLFGKQLRFDISKTVPLLTTKQVPWKSAIKELLWFLKGDTDANILKKQNVNIWNGNSSRDFLDKRGLTHYKEGDIGPMYGWQWRHFGCEYQGCDNSYAEKGIDQLKNVIELLKKDPFSRRIIMTTYNVADLEKGCLHPCHGLVVQFYVSVRDSKPYLSCHMYQRSVDSFLGLTWNIFSYAVLTYFIAKIVKMFPNELIISTGDTHLYMDHITPALQQKERDPYPSPVLIVKDTVMSKEIAELTVDDFEIHGYFHHPPIKASMSI